MDLTPNEMQFMNVFWRIDAPLTAAEILKQSVNRTWKDTSLHTILKNLLEKKVITEHGFVKDGKVISRTFVAVLTCEDYYAGVFADYPVKEIPHLFSALIRREDFGTDTIEKLEEMIRKRREEIQRHDK